MHIITLTIIINSDYIETVVFTAVNIDAAPAVLGIIWLELYNPWIDWRYKTIEFPFEIHCVEYRLLSMRALDIYNMVNFFISSVLEYYHEFLDIFNK